MGQNNHCAAQASFVAPRPSRSGDRRGMSSRSGTLAAARRRSAHHDPARRPGPGGPASRRLNSTRQASPRLAESARAEVLLHSVLLGPWPRPAKTRASVRVTHSTPSLWATTSNCAARFCFIARITVGSAGPQSSFTAQTRTQAAVCSGPILAHHGPHRWDSAPSGLRLGAAAWILQRPPESTPLGLGAAWILPHSLVSAAP